MMVDQFEEEDIFEQIEAEMEEEYLKNEKKIEKVSKEMKNPKKWITKDRKILNINELTDSHLNNINNQFKLQFKRLFNVKKEIFIRKIKNLKMIGR